MSSRLRTVASFDVAYKADLARTLLEESGITAYVTDREIVSMEWLLGAAVNGVKVQVPEEQVERAEAILEERFAGDLQPFAEGVGDDELTRQALEAAPETDDRLSADEPITEPPPAPAPDHAPETERDQYARRFMLASVFSLIMPPFAFYALYLGLNAAFGAGTLTAAGRRRLVFGFVFGGVWVLLVLLVLGLVN